VFTLLRREAVTTLHISYVNRVLRLCHNNVNTTLLFPVVTFELLPL